MKFFFLRFLIPVKKKIFLVCCEWNCAPRHIGKKMQSAQPGDAHSKFKITLRKSIVEEEYESETEGHVVVEGEIAPDSVSKKNSILKNLNY